MQGTCSGSGYGEPKKAKKTFLCEECRGRRKDVAAKAKKEIAEDFEQSGMKKSKLINLLIGNSVFGGHCAISSLRGKCKPGEDGECFIVSDPINNEK